MIRMQESAQQKIKQFTKDNFYVVTDFDRTLTKGNSITSWSILSECKLLPREYAQDRQRLYDYYRPIEIDDTLEESVKCEEMKKWYEKHIDLFTKYELKEDLVKKAASNHRIMEFRIGAEEFLSYLQQNSIPAIIISAGIGNFIEQFLIDNKCNYDNIYISSNCIHFTNGVADGMEGNLIHSLNKNEVSLPKTIQKTIAKRPYTLLLGDTIEDTRMVPKSKKNTTLYVGFLPEDQKESKTQYEQAFDLVCEKDTSYLEIMKLLNFN